jgi:hypothetical protein
MAKKKSTSKINSIILIVVGLMIVLYGLVLKSTCAVPKECLGWDSINPACLIDAAIQNAQIGYCLVAFDIVKWIIIIIGAILTILSFRRLAK